MIKATIIQDSIAPSGERLTTYVLKFHRYILPQFNTHRALSRNAASSRAIPVKKIIAAVENDPAIPIHWGKNKPGMQATEELSPIEQELAVRSWLIARDHAVNAAKYMIENLNIHKQVVNRLLEPFSWSHVVLTATEFGNFYNLRFDEDPQPEIRELSKLMIRAQRESKPVKLYHGMWHLPYVTQKELNDYSLTDCQKMSVARCARVSYLNHDGSSPNPEKDFELHDDLLKNGHMSPFEHQATPLSGWWANFKGWKQYRKFIPNENRAAFDIYSLDEEVLK